MHGPALRARLDGVQAFDRCGIDDGGAGAPQVVDRVS